MLKNCVRHRHRKVQLYAVDTAYTARVFSLPGSSAYGQLSVTLSGSIRSNLLGILGDCEDLAVFTSGSNLSGTLDNTQKVFGSNSIKLTSSIDGAAYRYKDILSTLSTGKYYLVTAYVKNGNFSTSGLRLTLTTVGDQNIVSAYTTSTSWVRVGIVVQPSDFDTATNAYLRIYGTGLTTEYGYVDGICLEEITAAEYALGATALMAYKNFINGVKSAFKDGGRIKSIGKNLAKLTPGTITANGVTVTVGNDGYITVNGTSTTTTYFKVTNGLDSNNATPNPNWYAQSVMPLANIDYRLAANYNSGSTSNTSYPTFGCRGSMLQITNYSVNATAVSQTKINTESNIAFFFVGMAVGFVFDNYKFRPQFENGTIATAWEPYTESAAYIPASTNGLTNVGTVKDEISVDGIKAQRNKGIINVTGTDFASLDTSYTNVDVVKTIAYADAKVGTTGIDGFTRYWSSAGVELPEVTQANIDLAASIGSYYYHTDNTIFRIVAKGTYANIAAARTGLGTATLNYQLLNPVVTNPTVRIFENGAAAPFMKCWGANTTFDLTPAANIETNPDGSNQITLPGTATLSDLLCARRNDGTDNVPVWVDVLAVSSLNTGTRKVTITGANQAKKYFVAASYTESETTVGTTNERHPVNVQVTTPRKTVLGESVSGRLIMM